MASLIPTEDLANFNRITGGNVMRHNYRTLTEQEKRDIETLKDHGLTLWKFITSLHHGDPNMGVFTTRELATAMEKVEEAVMWATKHITR